MPLPPRKRLRRVSTLPPVVDTGRPPQLTTHGEWLVHGRPVTWVTSIPEHDIAHFDGWRWKLLTECFHRQRRVGRFTEEEVAREYESLAKLNPCKWVNCTVRAAAMARWMSRPVNIPEALYPDD